MTMHLFYSASDMLKRKQEEDCVTVYRNSQNPTNLLVATHTSGTTTDPKEVNPELDDLKYIGDSDEPIGGFDAKELEESLITDAVYHKRYKEGQVADLFQETLNLFGQDDNPYRLIIDAMDSKDFYTKKIRTNKL